MSVENRTILLIQPPIRDFYFTRKRSIPYGLASIASVLEQQGFSVVLIDGLATSKFRIIEQPVSMAYLESYYRHEDRSPFSLFHSYKHFGYSFEHLGKLARMSRAFLVGISSLFTAYADEALAVAREVKKALPESRIVLGGHHPTQLPEQVMKDPAVDYVIRGEGEYAMAELAQVLVSGAGIEHVPGLVFRDENGRLHMNKPVIVDDPEDFPLPAMHLVNRDFYSRGQGASAVITASRGCPMACSYCCVARGTSRYRRRSVDSVFSEIERSVKQYHTRFIDFEDENLTFDRSWCVELFNRMLSEFGDLNLELRAMNGLFPSTLDEDLIVMMKKAGFRTLNLSLCTTAPGQLNRFRRPDVTSALDRALDIAVRLGMEAVTYIIVGAPGQDPYESVSDLVYLSTRPTLAGVSVYYPAPGSADWNRYLELNGLPGDFAVLRSSAVPISDTTTRIDSLTLLRLGRILNFSKDLMNSGETLAARPITGERLDVRNRHEAGKRLLEAFYHDGNIRGIRSDGSVYVHEASQELCDAFRNGTEAVIMSRFYAQGPM